MNRRERINLLVEAHAQAIKQSEQERTDKAQVERIAQAVKAKLTHVHASDDDDLVCPSCGYRGDESDFEPDTDDESDGYRTDDVTSVGDGNEDEDNEGDRELDAKGKSRVVAELLRYHKRRRY